MFTEDFPAALIPLSVVLFGLDWVSGFPLITLVSSFLSQNGF